MHHTLSEVKNGAVIMVSAAFMSTKPTQKEHHSSLVGSHSQVLEFLYVTVSTVSHCQTVINFLEYYIQYSTGTVVVAAVRRNRLELEGSPKQCIYDLFRHEINDIYFIATVVAGNH
jgi:hypothetical protein